MYKLSGESSSKENDQRTQLLAEHPELADLVIRIQQNAADNDARSQLVAAYFDHQLYWAAYEILTAADATNEVDSETSLNLARIWDVWGQYDLALKYGERAIVAGDSSPRAFEVIGRIHLHRNEPAAAIGWYTRAAQQSDARPYCRIWDMPTFWGRIGKKQRLISRRPSRSMEPCRKLTII